MSLPIQPRAGNFYGGWALIAADNTCPPNTTDCSSKSCCPTNTVCNPAGAVLSDMCCPSDSDCSALVKKASVCADPSWTLYNSFFDPICCLPGQVAIQPGATDLQGSCVDKANASSVASFLFASTAVTGAPAHTGTVGATPTYATGKVTATASGSAAASTGTGTGKSTKTSSGASAKATASGSAVPSAGISSKLVSKGAVARVLACAMVFSLLLL